MKRRTFLRQILVLLLLLLGEQAPAACDLSHDFGHSRVGRADENLDTFL